MTFAEKLAAAKAARPFKDQAVILDGTVSAEREALEAELEADTGDERMGVVSNADKARERLDEIAGDDSSVTIRVFRMPGRDWANLTSKCPARLDVPMDKHYGYNYDAVCEAALRYREPSGEAFAFRLEDGEPVGISDEEWSQLVSVLSGNEYAKLRDIVWELNEFEPEQRLQALVKG